MELELEHIIQVILRIGSAFSLTVSAIIVGILLYKGRLYHPIIWKYVGGIISALAIWRWVLVFMLRDDLNDIYTVLNPWIQPINQMFYLLTGVMVIVLTLSFRRDSS